MSSLQIRFLGDFTVKAGGEPVAALNKARLQSLLAYLILHRDAPQSRSYLAGLLWPDSPEAQAHTNLRNLVHLLREALPGGGDLICADNLTLQWNPQAAFELDALAFQTIAFTRPLQAVPLEKLEDALQLYQGDLLPGCYEDWACAAREQFHLAFVALLDHLIDRYEALRRYPEAIRGCQRLVAVEPFHKDGYPRLMRLWVLNGEVPLALKTYRDYARLLKRELQIEPPLEMQDLYAHIKQSAGHARDETMPSGRLPLVGRTAEWRAAQSFWKTAAQGNAGMLLICGEAGIGKTRLSEDLLDWASRQGIRTAAAHSYASEGALPYAPVVEWLRALRLPPLDRVWLTELARLLPELLKGSALPPAPLSETWQRLRLFEALARAVLGARQKTLLLIEDLQWCDRDTLEWLHYLLRFDPHAPLLVVGTARSEEISANPACSRLLADLRQASHTLEIELGPLTEPETGQLAAQVAGKALERGLGALLFQETEGNPLFIVETVHSELFRQARLPGVQPLPYKVHAVLENRIHQLSPNTRQQVLLAATIGRAFPLEILRQASGADEAELVTCLDEMLQRRIVREIAANTYDFCHDKLRTAAFAGVSAAHRQFLHRQVAEALAGPTNPDPDGKSGEIASHFEQAGCPEQAIQYYQLAADSARKIFANDLAIQYYQRAITLAEIPFPLLPPDQLAQLYEKLGDMLALVGQYSQAQAAFERALAQPFSSHRLWRAQIFRKISEAQMNLSQRQPAQAALDQAEAALNLSDAEGTLLERQEWIQIQLARSEIFYWGSQPDQMDPILAQILPIIEAEGRPDQLVALLDHQIMARLRHERYHVSAETVALAVRRLDLVNTLKVPYDIAWAQFDMGFVRLWHAEPAAGRDWLLKAYEAGLRMGARLLQLRSLTYLSVAERQLGDCAALREQLPRLLELAAAMGETSYQGIGQANQGWLAWREGDFARAEELCSAAVELWAQNGGFMFHWLANWVLLAMAVWRRDLPRAEAVARRLLDSNQLFQPIKEEIRAWLNEALSFCHEPQAEGAFQRFNQALELVKASGDL